MTEKCNEKGGGLCDKAAAHTVEKRADLLGHRALFLCDKHADKYRQFPDDFIVNEIKSAR